MFFKRAYLVHEELLYIHTYILAEIWFEINLYL